MTTMSVARKWDPLVVSWLHFCAMQLFPICADSFIGRNFEPKIVFICESVHHSPSKSYISTAGGLIMLWF